MSPSRAPRYCLHPRCRERVTSGRCEEHARQHEAEDRETRGTSAERGYDATWRRIRKRKLKRDPLCEMCEQDGYAVQATEVDHIVPLNQGGTHEWSNLQSICRPCHAQKTAKECSVGV